MKAFTAVILSALVLHGCSKLPRPEFTYSPETNPEAGDTIRFTNESRYADAYHWVFGDGGDSYDSDPVHIYKGAGIYEVELNTSNDDGSQMTSQTLTINEPTILGFVVYDSSETILFPGADIWLYDNEADRDSLVSPLFSGITDSNGVLEFRNLEAVIYHVWISKELPGGFWSFRGHTNKLVLNKVNYYSVACGWSEE